jgi:23S rRNA (uridine2552-2'-O)-methyltransferase
MNQNIKINKLNKLKKPLSHQSIDWVKRHLNDPFVKKARKEGYISRAAYKLVEIQDKYNLIKCDHNIVELGSAPGGWSQVTIDLLKKGNIFAIDLLEMSFCNQNLHFIQGNFITEQNRIIDKINEILPEDDKKIYGVLSDMAPSTCGDRQINHWKIMELCNEAFEFAKNILAKNGYFVAKIFMGGEEKDFINELKKNFTQVDFFKPKASRQVSTEIYVIAKGFRKNH